MAHIPAPSRYRQGGGSSSSSSSQPQRETNHILQDSQPRTPISWTPSLGLAFRLILIVRLLGARFSIISDCDETYNYWEALHLLVFPPSAATSNSSGAGLSLLPFQTWEYAPQFAIRSYAYLLPYLGFVKVAGSIVPLNKINTFFVLRNMLAVISSLVEAKFCVAVGESIHPRVAKYLFVFLLTSAGMSSAATGLLPSTFTMYTTTLALAYAFYPSRLASPNPIPAPSNLTLSQTPFLRTLIATATFALGALLGWPFAIVLSLPFVLEEILLPSGNSVPGSFSRYSSFVSARLRRFILGALLSGITIGGLTIVIDTLAYGKLTVVPLGIVMYNVLSAQRGAGPELYGIEPASYYFANLGLAFNIALPLALLSAPLVILTAVVDPKQLGPPSRTFPLAAKEKKDTLVSSSRMTLLLVRLAPFYTWLGLLTAQSHKEERFMFPAYPLVCFNAAVAVYLGRALLVKLLATSPTSRNQQAPSSLPSKLTTFLLLTTTLLSLLRTIHLQSSFYAPTAILEHFTNREIPHLIGRAFPLSITAPVAKTRIAAGLDAFVREEDERAARIKQGGGVQTEGMFGKLQDRFRVTAEPARLPSLTGLVNMSVLLTEFGAGDGKPAPLRLCYGKEWYRFPGHFFVPHGVGVDFVKSEFTGILPKHYRASGTATELRGWEKKVVDGLDRTLGWSWGLKDVTRTVQDGFNDMNREEPDRYVDINTCDYLVDLDHPHRFASADPKRSSLEPRHAIDSDRWTRVHCIPFLDSAAPSPPKINGGGSLSKIVRKVLAVLDRTLYVPGPVRSIISGGVRVVTGESWESERRYGDFCLLRTTRRESWANRRGEHVRLS